MAALAAGGIGAARDLYTTVPSDTVRVAALVEIAAAAAALARTVVKLRRLDPDLIAPHVIDPVDLRAVLGRGRWLPGMVRHVPAPPTKTPPVLPTRSVQRRRTIRRRTEAGQLALFTATGGGDR